MAWHDLINFHGTQCTPVAIYWIRQGQNQLDSSQGFHNRSIKLEFNSKKYFNSQSLASVLLKTLKQVSSIEVRYAHRNLSMISPWKQKFLKKFEFYGWAYPWIFVTFHNWAAMHKPTYDLKVVNISFEQFFEARPKIG